ncbi:UPF0481 protein At3g47200-like [Arachis stenosperma]|uniref:UPF0481 protein At3g47200-like n=1 Tax=Arachis stenosperma TaxID=217475 RepID=UPI0025AD3025|nr:UPF0481 protein At3g47200-like [Arachis stenosperma]
MEDHESHNPNDVAMEINEMLEKAQPLFRDECCIYRVPHEIRSSNADAYTPRAFSIGPFHHGDQKLLKMEDQKRIYCRQFIARSETKSLESFVSCVQELEPLVRACYSDDIKLSKEEHVMLILVDCCFILELLLRFPSEESKEDDSISLFPWLDEYLRWDLLLLENQIPFFVFNNLYDLAFSTLNGGTGHPSLLKLILGYFFGPYDDTDWDSGSIEHFTDLLRTFHLKQSISPLSRNKETLPFLKSAIQLHEAGVKFKVINKRSLCLLDLKFSGRTLEIPQIELEDKTEIWLRNMVALEQCYYPDESYITDYTAVLDYLINTEKDVDFLVNKGIIINWLGDSKAVAKLFNGLGKNIIHETFNAEYLRICKDLNDFCEHPCLRKVATLRRDYCNTPWKTVASVAGIALLILTVIQTACSIIQVVQGFSK